MQPGLWCGAGAVGLFASPVHSPLFPSYLLLVKVKDNSQKRRLLPGQRGVSGYSVVPRLPKEASKRRRVFCD